MVITPLFFSMRGGALLESLIKTKRLTFIVVTPKRLKKLCQFIAFIVHDKSYITRGMSGHLKCD
jgi:hypothetical protein